MSTQTSEGTEQGLRTLDRSELARLGVPSLASQFMNELPSSEALLSAIQNIQQAVDGPHAVVGILVCDSNSCSNATSFEMRTFGRPGKAMLGRIQTLTEALISAANERQVQHKHRIESGHPSFCVLCFKQPNFPIRNVYIGVSLNVPNVEFCAAAALGIHLQLKAQFLGALNDAADMAEEMQEYR